VWSTSAPPPITNTVFYSVHACQALEVINQNSSFYLYFAEDTEEAFTVVNKHNKKPLWFQVKSPWCLVHYVEMLPSAGAALLHRPVQRWRGNPVDTALLFHDGEFPL